MIRSLIRLVFGLVSLVTACVTVFVLMQSPFSQPYVARGQAELRAALNHALDRQLTPQSVALRVEDALSREEVDEAAAIVRLSDNRKVVVDPELRERVNLAQENTKGLRACIACAFEPAACSGVAQVAACNLPLELTPVGDVMAINRALEAYANESEVDRIDLTLGLVGLTATGAVVVTGGSTAAIKAGTAAFRVARRTGAMNGLLSREMTDLTRRSLRPEQVNEIIAGRASLASLADTGAMKMLRATANDVGRIANSTSPADTLALMRYADSTDDLSRIANIAGVTGDDTWGAFAVLGKARVLRTAHRLSDAVILAIGLLAALSAQVCAILFWIARRSLRPRRRRVRS